MDHSTPMITNDAVVLGLLMAILAVIFITSHSEKPVFKKFYRVVPALLLCYFVPSVFSSLGVISGEASKLYFVSSRYLLPTCLVLLCLSIDLKGIMRLGPKAVIMFFTGTLGIIAGGPIAFLIVAAIAPDIVKSLGVEDVNAVWRGMTTVAGSWIGGGANQTAMKEIFGVGDKVFSSMIAVDVIVANIWMACLLFASGDPDKYDRMLGADNSAIKELQTKMADYQAKMARIPNLTELMTLLGVGFAVTALGHLVADNLAPALSKSEYAPFFEKISLTSKFFWLIMTATAIGLGMSFTKVARLEAVGASRIGSAMLYVLIASIGMKMDITAVAKSPGLFMVGLIWIAIHGGLLILVAKLIRAPLFFLAVGSQANVGGAASAPVVASAFHPTLAPVGVLLAVFGYFVGTIGAWLCGLILQAAAGG